MSEPDDRVVATPFPAGRLEPAGAALDATIEWDSDAGLEPALEHTLTVSFSAMSVDAGAEPVVVELTIDSIRVPVRSWRELTSRTFRFPNPILEVEIDGETRQVWDAYPALRIGSELYGVDLAELRFGTVADALLPVEIVATVPGAGYERAPFSPAPVRLAVAASVEPLEMAGDAAGDEYPDLDEAAHLAARLIDTAAYHPPRLVDDRVIYPPRLG